MLSALNSLVGKVSNGKNSKEILMAAAVGLVSCMSPELGRAEDWCYQVMPLPQGMREARSINNQGDI